MVVSPPELEHGPARDRDPRRRRDRRGRQDRAGPTVDIIATYPGDQSGKRPNRSIVVVAGARIIDVGQPRLKGGNGVRAQQDPDAGRPRHVRAHHGAGAEGQLRRVVRAGGPAGAAAARRGRHAQLDQTIQGRGPDDRREGRVSQRLLIAVADEDVAPGAPPRSPARATSSRSSSASPSPRRSTRALRRSDIDVVLLHDALGGVPVIDLARELAAGFPEVGMVLLAADDSPDAAALRHAGGHPRRRLAPALARAARGQRPRRRPVVARAARPRGGRGDGGRRARRPADRRRRRQGRRRARPRSRCTSRWPPPAMRPGARSAWSTSTSRRATCARYMDTPYRRSVVDLVEVADEISVRHLQETLYTHREGVRAAARARRRRARRGGRLDRRAQRARRRQGARTR